MMESDTFATSGGKRKTLSSYEDMESYIQYISILCSDTSLEQGQEGRVMTFKLVSPASQPMIHTSRSRPHTEP